MQRHPAKEDTSLYQIFERINSSGKTLLPQEIRNCIYQGALNSLLIEVNQNQQWRELYGRAAVDERMRDLELVLRFFALSDEYLHYGDDFPSTISLKKHLNKYMDKNNNENLITSFRERFISSVNFVHTYIGKGAFHNISPTDNSRLVEKFSPTVYDSVLIAVDRELRNSKGQITHSELEGKRRSILMESDYQQLLSQETMRTPNILARVSRMHAALFGNGKA